MFAEEAEDLCCHMDRAFPKRRRPNEDVCLVGGGGRDQSSCLSGALESFRHRNLPVDVLIHCVQGEARVPKQNRAMKSSDGPPRLVSTDRRPLVTRFCSGDVFWMIRCNSSTFLFPLEANVLLSQKTQERGKKGVGVRGRSRGAKGERTPVQGVQTPERPRNTWGALKTQAPTLSDSWLGVRPGRLRVRLDLWGDLRAHRSARITEQSGRGKSSAAGVCKAVASEGCTRKTRGRSRAPPAPHGLLKKYMFLNRGEIHISQS